MARITGLNQCPPLPLFLNESLLAARAVLDEISSGFSRKRLCHCTQTLGFELYTRSMFFVCYEMRCFRCGRLRAPLAVTL